MKTSHATRHNEAADWFRLNDTARRRAQELRREAIADFGHGAARVASRLLSTIVRFAQARSAQAATATSYPKAD